MSDDEKPNNAWLQDAIARAKQSALPLLLREFIEEDGADVDAMCDAVELALLSITGDVSEEKLRAALRSVAEPYAESIGAKWENVADAILGTLEWVPPDKSTHILDAWGGNR
jgi:hypothetical protein